MICTDAISIGIPVCNSTGSPNPRVEMGLATCSGAIETFRFRRKLVMAQVIRSPALTEIRGALAFVV